MASITKDANGKIIKRNVSIISTTPVSYPTVGLGAVDNNYNTNINSLTLNGTNVTATSTQLNYTNVTPGTATASKAIVLGSNSSISNLNSVSCSTITVNGQLIDGTTTSAGSAAYLANANPGTATANTAAVLNSSSNISNINSLSVNNLDIGNNVLTASNAKISNNIKKYTNIALPNNNQWTSMCWSPSLNLFAAVSSTGTGNRVMTSADGNYWMSRTSPADNNWTSICWSPKLSLFVAVASSGTGNRVMTSINGINWTSRTSAADNNWTSVCWSPSLKLFVAVSSSGTDNRVMTSVDGITWTSRTSAANNNWTSVCWSNTLSLFVVVASSGTGNRIMTSSDGITWTSRTSAADNNWTSVCWGINANIFVAVASSGTNRLMISSDGINWITQNILNNDWNDIIWCQELNIFAVVSLAGNYNHIAYSSDSINWHYCNNSVYNGLSCIDWSPTLSSFSILSAWASSNINPGTLLSNWNNQILNSTIGNSFKYITWIDDLSMFIAAGDSGLMFRSYNGENWILTTLPIALNITCIAWSSTEKVAVAMATSGLYYSYDGINWTRNMTSSILTNGSGAWVTWSKYLNLFVMVKASNPSNTIRTSVDGINWTNRSVTISSINWTQIIWSEELRLFVCLASSGTTTLYSSDGINWTSGTCISGVWRSVDWSPTLNLFVAVGDSGNKIQTSSDGITWTARTSPNTSNWNNVCWSSTFNVFVAISYDTSNNSMMYSSDGINWTAQLSLINEPWQYICFSPRLNTFVGITTNTRTEATTMSVIIFIKTNNYTNLSLLSSNASLNISDKNINTSLTNWTDVSQSSASYSLRSVFWIDELSLFIAVGTDGTIITSPDGSTWTTQTVPVNNNWNCVAWSPNLRLLVAVSNSNNAANAIITSPDGITWTTRTVPRTDNWYTICWSSNLNMFVAVAQNASNNSTIIKSNDGINWTESTGTIGEWWQIIWNAEYNMFIVAGTGNLFMRSSDGTTWATITVSATSNWKSITWSPKLELFVAVADSGSTKVMTSSNGTTWTNRMSETSSEWWNVCWSSTFNMFVAVSANTNNNYIMYSLDGINWTTVLSQKDGSAWYYICFSPKFNTFVAIANSNTINIMKTSNYSLTSLINSNTNTTQLDISNAISSYLPTIGNLKNVLKNLYTVTPSLVWAWTSIVLIPKVIGSGTTSFNGYFYVATSPSGIAYSVDLITWTACTSSSVMNWSSVAWSSNLSIGVCVSNSGTNQVSWFTVPETVTAVANTNIGFSWNSVCWSTDLLLFVAVASSGTGNRVMTSSDGKIWTLRQSAADNNWNCVCWSSELMLFVAVASSGNDNRVMTSSDGFVWRSRTSANDNNWTSVCWSPELMLFIAVASSGTNNRIMKSSDGITWSSVTSPADNNWTSVIWISDLYLYVACASSGTDRLMYSSDGNNWYLLSTPSNNSWTNIYWNNIMSEIIVIASNGTDRILSSNIFKSNSNNTLSGGQFLTDNSTGYVSLNTYTTPTYQFEYTDSRKFNSNLYLYATSMSNRMIHKISNAGTLSLSTDDVTAANSKPSLNIVNHNGVDSGLALNGSLLTVTASTLNNLSNITYGSASASTPISTNSIKNISGLNQISCTSLTVSNIFNNITAGVAKSTSPLIVDSNLDIKSINKVSSTSLQINNNTNINVYPNALVNNVVYNSMINIAVVNNLNTANSEGNQLIKAMNWFPDLQQIIAIEYNNSIPSCYISTSVDGVSWTTTSSRISICDGCSAITYSPSLKLYVATSDKVTSNSINTSSNLVSWTNISSSINRWSHACWCPFANKFILFGSNSSTALKIAYSSDGINWTILTFNTSISDVKFVGFAIVESPVNKIFAVNNRGHVYYSSDGINWTVDSSYDKQIDCVAYSPTLNMILLGGTGVLYVTNLSNTNISITNSPTITGVSSFKTMIWASGLNIFIGNSLDRMDIVISKNGTNWNYVNSWKNLYSHPYTSNPYFSNLIWIPTFNRFVFSIINTNYSSTFSTLGYSNSSQLSNTPYSTNNNLTSNIDLQNLNKKIKKSSGILYNSLNTWYTRSAIADVNWKFVNWFSEVGKFIAVGESQQYSYNGIMTSTDGKTWSQPFSPDKLWTSIAYSSSLSRFVVVGNSNDIVNVCFSTNGDDWTEYFGASANLWTSVCWSPELAIFVAVASSGTGNRVMTSANGMTWTSRTSAADNNWTSVCWSPELTLFVAVASSGTGNRVMTSPDGINWTIRTSAANNNWTSVCWNLDMHLFVAVASSGNGNRIMTSPDGITWTTQISPANYNWNTVIYVSELNVCVAISNNTTNTKQNAIMFSSDCYNWKLLSYRNATSWTSICWSPEYAMFVTVSNTGTANSRVNNSKMAFNSTKNTVIANSSNIIVDNINSRVGLGMTPTTQLQLSTDSAAKPSTSTWTVSSDERLKENIQDADLDLCYNNVDKLRLVKYTWKDEVYTTDQVSDRSKLGWIAQEVETVFPKAVEKHNMHGYDDCRTLNNDQIIASLYGCIQKLIQKCESRQNTIDQMKNKYNELSNVFDNLEFVTE